MDTNRVRQSGAIKMQITMKSALGVATALLLFMGTVQAGPITITATERGAYRSDLGAFGTGGSGTASGNYLTGLSGGREYRSFFNFDLSSIAGPIGSATINISLLDFGSGGVTPETFALFDYIGDINDLVTNAGGFAAYADLGSGTTFGSASVVPTDPGVGTLSIALNASGVAALNAALGGDFAVGGAITTLAGSGDQYLFGSSLGNPPTSFTLVVNPIPEPSTFALLGLGGFGLLWVRRRRKAA